MRNGTNAYYLEFRLLDIGKARLFKRRPLHIILQHRHGPPHLLPALDEELSKLAHGRLFVHGAIVAAEVDGGLVGLDEAAGLKGLVGFPEEGGPVLDAAKEPADVDVVKGVFFKGPRLSAVVDFAKETNRLALTRGGLLLNQGRDLQFAVGGNPGGLDCGEVGADNFRFCVLVRKVTKTKLLVERLS